MKTSWEKRRFPKVLADEIELALGAVSELGPDLTGDLLARYRRNRAKSIATWGLSDIGAPVVGQEFIPLEHLGKIAKLDEAYEKMHRYRNGGAGDYIASDVAKELSKARASLPRQRSRKYDCAAVVEFLNSRRYSDNPYQKVVIIECMEHFGISERSVRNIAAKAGLTKARKKSTAT